MENIEGNRSSWTVNKCAKVNIKECILIEGLPGIGNVGKIAADFIIDQNKSIKLYEFFSHDLPHSVFIKEDNLVDLPKLELHLIKKGKTTNENLLFLVGDVQPINERSCYEFCHLLLNIAQDLNCKEIITTGGIGLPKVPKNPKVYCTANDKEIVKKYKKFAKINHKTYGVVGPVVGVTGLLVGLAGQKNLAGISLLTETFAHPMYLGMTSARNLLEVLNKAFELKLDLNNIDKEITDIENEVLMRTQQLKQLKDLHERKEDKLNYIG
jgi:uncharacterized protein